MKAENEIIICMGSACFARGNAQNLELITNYIAKENLQARIEIAGSRCESKCADGPNIKVNDIEYNNVDEKKVKTILANIKKKQKTI